jgi:hypothetical protein
MHHYFSLALAAAFATLPLRSAVAQVAETGYSLPLTLALKAATASCASSGYPVSAVVVEASGVIKLEAKGDHYNHPHNYVSLAQGLHRHDLRANLPVRRVQRADAELSAFIEA